MNSHTLSKDIYEHNLEFHLISVEENVVDLHRWLTIWVPGPLQQLISGKHTHIHPHRHPHTTWPAADCPSTINITQPVPSFIQSKGVEIGVRYLKQSPNVPIALARRVLCIFLSLFYDSRWVFVFFCTAVSITAAPYRAMRQCGLQTQCMLYLESLKLWHTRMLQTKHCANVRPM